jgi:hypothetical protein
MELFISVIITGYHVRKQYMNSALNSVIKQRYPNSLYEIIVVKDYEDKNISKLTSNKDNNIIDLTVKDTNIGDTLVQAIQKANGDIICFLDDDDMFFDNKLEFVSNEFANDKNLTFLRNEITEIDKNGNNALRPDEWGGRTKNDIEILNNTHMSDEILRNAGLMSCISIQKNIILPHLQILSHLTTNQDLFMFLIALHSNKKLKIVKNQLTYYRISDSATRINGSFSKYLSTLRRIHKHDYIINNYFDNMFKNTANNEYINKKIFELNVVYFFVSNKRKAFKYIYSSINSGKFLTDKNKMFLLFLSFLHDIYPDFFLRINFINNKRKISRLL